MLCVKCVNNRCAPLHFLHLGENYFMSDGFSDKCFLEFQLRFRKWFFATARLLSEGIFEGKMPTAATKERTVATSVEGYRENSRKILLINAKIKKEHIK